MLAFPWAVAQKFGNDLLTAEPLRVHEVPIGAVTATVFWEALQLIGTWPGGRPPAVRAASSDGGPPSGEKGHCVVYRGRRRGIRSTTSATGNEPGSGTEQLGLGGREFVIGQHALLMQGRKLVHLVDHG